MKLHFRRHRYYRRRRHRCFHRRRRRRHRCFHRRRRRRRHHHHRRLPRRRQFRHRRHRPCHFVIFRVITVRISTFLQ